MRDHLFSYGTLQNNQVQIDLFGRILSGSKDILQGFKLAVIEITDEVFLSRGEQNTQRIAIATGDPQDQIEGMVFEVTVNELLHADKYEPNDYKRVKVTLASGKQAWVYAAS